MEEFVEVDMEDISQRSTKNKKLYLMPFPN